MSDAAKNKVFDSVLKQYHQNGWLGLTVRRITGRGNGFSAGVIYHHFDSLFEAKIAAFEALLAETKAVIESLDQTNRITRLESWLRFCLKERPAICRLLREKPSQLDEHLRQRLDEIERTLAALLCGASIYRLAAINGAAERAVVDGIEPEDLMRVAQEL